MKHRSGAGAHANSATIPETRVADIVEQPDPPAVGHGIEKTGRDTVRYNRTVGKPSKLSVRCSDKQALFHPQELEMSTLQYLRPPALLAVGFITLIVSTSLVLSAQVSTAAQNHNPNAAVTVTDGARNFTIDNGIVKATIRKDSGSMASTHL
jgi:hypothetical protein